MRQTGPDNGSVASGYCWTFGSTALPLAGAFIVSLIVARAMGPRAAGLINWTMAVATVFLIIAKFGVEGASSRLASEYQETSPEALPLLMRSGMILRLAFTLPTAAAAFLSAGVLAGFFGEPALTPLLRLGGLVIFSVSFNELAALLLLGLGRFRFLFLTRLLTFSARVGLTAAAAYLAAGPAGVLWAYAAASAVTAAAAFMRLPVGGRGAQPASGGAVTPRLLRLSSTLAISGASVTIYSMLDKIMLGYFTTATEVGIYSMARNLLETSLFPTFALVMTLRPLLARAWAAGERRRCSSLVNSSLRGAIFYSACAVTVFACLAGPLVTGLYSRSFAASARILVLFTPLLVMRAVGSVILPGLIASDRAGTYAWLTLTGAVLNFVLNILLIPRYGATGAVVSTLISYMPIEIAGLLALSRRFEGIWSRPDTVSALKTAAISAAMIFLFRRFVPEPEGLAVALLEAIALSSVLTVGLLASGALRRSELGEFVAPLARAAGRRS